MKQKKKYTTYLRCYCSLLN